MRRAGLLLLVLMGLLAAGTPAGLAATDYPLTIENCGTTVRFARAPTHVVAFKSTAIEMLLALGLADRVVGIGFQDSPVPHQWSDAASTLKVLADKLPSQEVVLDAQPDLVYAGWESNFSADGVGDRQTLERLGVATYISPAACRSLPFRPTRLRFDDVFEQIAEIGRIFDVADNAAALIAAQKAELASVIPDKRGLTALWYSSGTKVPYVGAGSGAPQIIMDAIGLDNIMADVDDSWISASWEVIADADPDVIVLVDADWNSVAQKKQLLAQNPVTRNLTAVRNERYLTIPFPASEAGIRSVGAAADMARQLKALSF